MLIKLARYDMFSHLVQLGVDVLQPVGPETELDTRTPVYRRHANAETAGHPLCGSFLQDVRASVVNIFLIGKKTLMLA